MLGSLVTNASYLYSILQKQCAENHVIYDLSPFLDLIYIKSHRDTLCRLLTSSHTPHVESGRWSRNPTVPRERRYCFNCNAKVEDEFHFVFECPIYSLLRRQLIPRYFRERPSMFKFINLLNSGCKKKLIGLAKYVYKANILRSQTITDRQAPLW